MASPTAARKQAAPKPASKQSEKFPVFRWVAKTRSGEEKKGEM